MKDIKDFINESIWGEPVWRELAATAETFGKTLAVSAIPVSYLVPWVLSFIYGKKWIEYPHQVIKRWYEDKKFAKILDRLKDDPDIKQFISQPPKKRHPGWRDLLRSKLSDEEIKYIHKITKYSVKSRMKQ